MNAVACLTLGYFMGTVNPAYVFSRMKGFDIRDRGSGNAGASNAVVMLGKAIGVLCALLDIFKAFLAFKLCKFLFPAMKMAGMLAGVGCILGHIFPVWMGFRGGKGLACLAGTILAYDWRLFLILLACEVVFVLLAGYICLVTLSASMVFPAIYWLQSGEVMATVGLLAVAAVMFVKHIDNLKRISRGHEVRISYLWNKEAEIERLRDIFPEDAENAV